MPRFRSTKEAEGEQWREELQEKDRFFDRYFSQKEIDDLDEGTLRELVHILWAFSGWTNKDYLFDEMKYEAGGYEALASSLVPDAGDQVVEACVGLLESLKRNLNLREELAGDT
jgi:hypothetical protein